MVTNIMHIGDFICPVILCRSYSIRGRVIVIYFTCVGFALVWRRGGVQPGVYKTYKIQGEG